MTFTREDITDSIAARETLINVLNVLEKKVRESENIEIQKAWFVVQQNILADYMKKVLLNKEKNKIKSTTHSITQGEQNENYQSRFN